MTELLFLGIFTGFISGFFGIGGGTILVPMLLFVGFDMKQAVAISIMQMVFSSIFGSYLNSKKYKEIFKEGLFIGYGGIAGGLLSGFIVSSVTSSTLEYLFTAIILFTLVKIALSKNSNDEKLPEEKASPLVLVSIGFVVGMIAMSIGVGGSIMITPILAGYFHYNLKHASALGLFFVIFSSISGFTSLSLHGQMLYFEGALVGIASLLGVYFGIYSKNKISGHSFKKYTIFMYIAIFTFMLQKIFNI
jgi:uncharacterized membrane protein YfcA